MNPSNKWIMEINTSGFVFGLPGWRAVRPTGGEPYQFGTKAEALSMLNTCYPDLTYGKEARVRQLEDGE